MKPHHFSVWRGNKLPTAAPYSDKAIRSLHVAACIALLVQAGHSASGAQGAAFNKPGPQDASRSIATAQSSRTAEARHQQDFEDPSFDFRMRELVAGLPSCTVLRLNEQGLPDVLMDMYFGLEGPATNEALLELAECFRFDDRAGTSGKAASGDDRDDLPDWRSVILPDVTMPAGEPKATYYDPESDIVVTFRPARMNLRCTMSWPVQFHGYRHSETTTRWYVYGDAVTAVAQARRDRNSNPNLYLDGWNGSRWQSLASSTQGAWMDYVGAQSSSCTRAYYRVRVYMSNEGYFSSLVVTFDATG